ncbi:hypothetical protein CANINC_004472 [Pichia inconspicua]|uniref:REM-1 domain-containing protein n=1 Tax=Pichia inconspicua TaxID=52247 RepID=A0A4T0WVC4_9ASCO|nr:hypothetical protein CANINC_004472 [[Candida] inconspicua]
MNIEDLNSKLTFEMEEELSGKEKATKHGVNRQLLLEGIKNLARISSSLQRNRAELETAKDDKKKLLKIMEIATQKQDDFLDLQDRGYIGIFNQYSPEVIAADNAPICLKIEEFNQMSYDHRMPVSDVHSDPIYYHQSPPPRHH